MSDSRRIILERRRRFVAAALAALGTPACATGAPPSAATSTSSAAPAAEPAPAVDSDGDGIADDVDRCPSVPGVEGRHEDELGCPARPCLSIVEPSEIQIVPKIDFAPGSDELRPQTTPILDELARELEDHPELHIEIVGRRAEGEAPKLALARAERVRHALVERGLDAARFTTKAAAETGQVRFVEFEVLSR